MELAKSVLRRGTCRVRGFLIFACLPMLIARTAAASVQLNPGCPLNFFTNVASRLLSSQLNLNLSHIQIYPTNQYTPAVHRLLQVTANILDATTTNYYPSVFRPLFWKTNQEYCGIWHTNVYIAGYQFVAEPLATDSPPIFNTPMVPDDPLVPFGLSGMTNNIYGVPWVIGVKKGLPNFDAFELVNCFHIERTLQMQKRTLDPATMFATNQMYIMAITNYFGAVDWNSYAGSYTNPISVVANDTVSVGMPWTNESDTPPADNPGLGSAFVNTFVSSTNIALQAWPGYAFLMMFGTNNYAFSLGIPRGSALETGAFRTALMNSSNPSLLDFAESPAFMYYYGPNPVTLNSSFGTFTLYPPCFIPAFISSSNYMSSGTPPLPQMELWITNHLQALMVDSTGHILDYVQLGGVKGYLNVNQAVADNTRGYANGIWSTNLFPGDIPEGVIRQIFTSQIGGTVPPEDTDGGWWAKTPIPGTTDTSPAVQQAFFSAFLSPNHTAPYFNGQGGYVTNLLTTMQLPYTPTRTVVQRLVYEANDPLVHYMASDLDDFLDSTNNLILDNPPLLKLLSPLGRFMPWGNDRGLASATFAGLPLGQFASGFDLQYRDPLVASPDDWNFPTNETLNASWLGQVHRGTPWQTIYLKSPDILTEEADSINIGIPTWELWTGDLNQDDAEAMAPVRDWQIAALLASLFNTNNEASLFSPNDPNPGDWENRLNGMDALTNDLPDLELGFEPIPQFATLVISSNSAQAAEIANAIKSTRQSQPDQRFPGPGSIFAVPQLSSDSPYLHLDTAQTDYAISDAAYEAIPSQLLPLLRKDSIGSITAASGQVTIQFSGDDNHVYAVQSSPNLVNWNVISTNSPIDGIFTITNPAAKTTRFYRTALLY